MSKQQKGPRPEPTDELATLRRRLEEAAEEIRGLYAGRENLLEELSVLRVHGLSRTTLEEMLCGLGLPKDGTWGDVLSEVLALKRRAASQPEPPPPHVVRAFESGARAERARVLEQSRVELLSWHLGTPERRALEALRKALQDERLPLPEFKP